MPKHLPERPFEEYGLAHEFYKKWGCEHGGLEIHDDPRTVQEFVENSNWFQSQIQAARHGMIISLTCEFCSVYGGHKDDCISVTRTGSGDA